MTGFSILYLPQLLLALMTTLSLNSSSLTILRNHPSLIVLSVFTFFTFAKQNNFCWAQPGDSRVMFCPHNTKINIGISTFSCIIFFFVMSNTIIDDPHLVTDYHELFFWVCTYLSALAVLLTLSFIYFDYICCNCCQCFLSAQQEIVVHDPEHPDTALRLEDGNIVEFKMEQEDNNNKK